MPEDELDLRGGVDIDDVTTTLVAVAADLRALWSVAVARSDFEEITRLVDASHAVHRAVVALRTDNVITAGGEEHPYRGDGS